MARKDINHIQPYYDTMGDTENLIQPGIHFV